MPNLIQAAAEGLPSVTRRNALSITGAGIAATLAGLATSAAAVPETARPGTRLRDAFIELETALEEWGGQQFGMRVYPAGTLPSGERSQIFDIEFDRGYALAAGLAYNRQRLDEKVTPELAALIHNHKKAWKAFSRSAGLGLATCKAADKIMRKLVAYRCQTQADRTAKAAYLAAHEDTEPLLDTEPKLLAS